MSLFNWLIRYLPSFPKIHQKEYETLQKECLNLIGVTKRIQHIPQNFRSNEDNYHLENLQFYQAVIDTPYNISITNFIEWLESINQPQTCLLWSEIIQNHLWQPEFLQLPVNQDLNLKLLRISLSLFNQPYAFSGLILAFFQKGYPCEQLIASGILQDFFQYQISEIQIIEKTYEQLRNLGLQYDGFNDYIDQIDNIQCGLDAYPHMSLLGQLSNHDLQTVEVIDCPLEIDNRHILEVFLHFFEIQFLFILLLTKDSFDKDCIDEFFRAWIQLQVDEDIEEIFHKIKTNLPPEVHFNIFKIISPYISIGICQKLFTTHPDFFWILLCTAPQLKELYDKSSLRAMACNHTFTIQQIPFIAHLCTKPTFIELHDTWIQQILESYLLQSDLELNQDIIHIIKSFSKTKPRCQAIAKKWHMKLIALIEEKTQLFSESNFIDIQDFFLAQRKIISKIEILGYSCQHNLKDHYDLTSYILAQLLDTQSYEQIQDWLNVLLPSYIQANQTEEEKFNNKKRIVLELFKRRLKPNHELLVLKIINILVFQFEVPLNKLISVLEQENIFIKILALKNPTTLSFYLNLLNHETKLKNLISRISHDNHLSIMQYAYQKPELLLIIIQSLDVQSLYKFLFQEYKKGEIWWHLMGKYPHVLSAILDKLTIEQKNLLLAKTNKFQENILHESLPIAESIETILLHAPDNIKERLLNTKNFQNRTPFTLALEAPDCFIKILTFLNAELLFSLLETPETSDSRFIQICNYPILMRELLHHLNREQKRELILKNFPEIIKKHIHRKEIIQIIFNQFDGVQNLQLMKTEINDLPLARHLLNFPESFIVAYQTVNPNLRLNLIVNCRLLSHLNRPQWTILENIIRGIPTVSVLNFFEYMIETNPKLIDGICADPNHIQKIISCVPKSILWLVMSYKNSAGDNFLKHLPVHNADIISSIIQSFPSTAQWSAITCNYENQKSLFERSIHFPKTFARLITFIPPIELYDLIKPGEFFASVISKCDNFESIILIFQNIPRNHHIEFLAQGHDTYRSVLHGFFHKAEQLPRLIRILREDALDWVCQKLQNQSLYFREIHYKPITLFNFLNAIPYPFFSKALIGLCYHYPEQTISNDIRQLFNQHHQPSSPLGRQRWFMNDYQTKPPFVKAKTYHDWLEILEGDIKEMHELSPRVRIS